MFDDFLKNCKMEDEINPSEERVEKNFASVMSLIEEEENNMTKPKFRLKPFIIAAFSAIFSVISLFAVIAATESAVLKFFLGEREIEGNYDDYVDRDGYRHITFTAELPIEEGTFAIIYDVDAPRGENVRVITNETDPDFMERIRLYREVNVEPENFGLVFKSSELCIYSWAESLSSSGVSFLGGDFTKEGAAFGKPSGYSEEYHYDYENGIKIIKETLYYYVGKK